MKTPVSEVVAPVAGLVLAAGFSTRMGRNKQLLELRGETVVARAARMAHEAGLSPVVVVLGHQAELVRAAVAHLTVLTVENPSPERGMASSVREGIAALEEHAPAAPAAVVILSDMPLVTAAMVRGWLNPGAIAALPSSSRSTTRLSPRPRYTMHRSSPSYERSTTRVASNASSSATAPRHSRRAGLRWR